MIERSRRPRSQPKAPKSSAASPSLAASGPCAEAGNPHRVTVESQRRGDTAEVRAERAVLHVGLRDRHRAVSGRLGVEAGAPGCVLLRRRGGGGIEGGVLGKRVRGRFILDSAEEKAPGQLLLRHTVTVEIEQEDKPALTAVWLGLMFI